MAREEMMSNVMRQFGLEDNVTIAFCLFAEDPKAPQKNVEQIYKRLMGKDE